MNTKFCCKLFVTNPFHFRNVFSTLAITNAHSQSLFSQFVSSKFNMSAADITRMCKAAPRLQKLQTLEIVEQFIDILSKRGCTEVQIANIMRVRPEIICSRAKRKIETNIKLLEDFGFEGQNLMKLLTMNPSILGTTLENGLLPKLEFLKSVFQSQDVLVKALLRSPYVLRYSLENTLKPSVAFWEAWGFRGMALSRFLAINPRVLLRTSLTTAQVNLIHKIGADKENKMFKYIVSIVAGGRMETLEAKIENLKLCGLPAEEIWQVLRASPTVLCLSSKNVSEKMNFIVNNMELPANYVVKHPSMFQINLEKTLRPRFLVWQKIKSTNDLGLTLLTVMKMKETRFVSEIIEGHPESKILWSIYENAISNAPNCTKSSTKS